MEPKVPRKAKKQWGENAGVSRKSKNWSNRFHVGYEPEDQDLIKEPFKAALCRFPTSETLVSTSRSPFYFIYVGYNDFLVSD